MVSLSLFLLVMGGSVAGHVLGMKMMDTTSAKLGASAEARRTLSSLLSEVRSAQSVMVGNGDLSSFTNAGIGQPQQGNTLQIYPSGETNEFIRYFWDSGSKALKRMTSGSRETTLIASAIKNSVVFTAEDYAGNVLNDSQNNCTVGLLLEFSQLGGQHRPIGVGKVYTTYRLRSKLTRRGN